MKRDSLSTRSERPQGPLTDVERSEFYLREGERLARMGSWSLRADGIFDYWSPETFAIFDFDPAKGIPTLTQWLAVLHNEDRDRLAKTIDTIFREGVRADVRYWVDHPKKGKRMMHSTGEPVLEDGKVTRLIGNTLDITEHENALEEIRRLKDELYKENIVLREEINSTSMFEEVLGTSAVLQRVLALAAKVAPTDSTVLIMGETGTGFAGFSHIDASGEPPGATQAAPEWGPVQTDKASIANLSPVLLPFFNNGPVFGLPGTVVGDFWQNTQLTGDWGGFRTSLAEHGVFFDLYSTSAYQDVASGGLKTGSSFVQNIQLSINIDTGRAGLWPGGVFHFTVGSRFGDSAKNTFTVGSSVPQNTGLAFPGPFFDRDIYPTEYFLVQALTPQFSLLLGKLTIVQIADQTIRR